MNISKTEDAVGQTDMSKKITSKPNHLIRVIYIVFVPTMPMISLAQDSPTLAQESLIEEVLVTARKREEGLQDIPSSAAAISAALIEGIGGIFNLRDMTDLVVGVSINENQAAESESPYAVQGRHVIAHRLL